MPLPKRRLELPLILFPVFPNYPLQNSRTQVTKTSSHTIQQFYHFLYNFKEFSKSPSVLFAKAQLFLFYRKGAEVT